MISNIITWRDISIRWSNSFTSVVPRDRISSSTVSLEFRGPPRQWSLTWWRSSDTLSGKPFSTARLRERKFCPIADSRDSWSSLRKGLNQRTSQATIATTLISLRPVHWGLINYLRSRRIIGLSEVHHRIELLGSKKPRIISSRISPES